MNSNLRDALRLGIQSAFAAALFFSLHRIFQLNEAFVGTISAVLIVQPSIGSTIHAGFDRVLATLMGSVIGVVCLLLVPHGYGTAVALFVSMFAVNAAAGVKPDWRYGVVAAVAISLGAESNAIQTALDRGLSIGLGVLVGLLVSVVVWPDSAEKRAKNHLKDALCAIGERLSGVLAQMDDGAQEDPNAGRDLYHRAISDAEDAVSAIKGDDRAPFQQALRAVKQLYTATLLVHRASNNETVSEASRDSAPDTMKTIRKQLSEQIENLRDGQVSVEGLSDIELQIDALAAEENNCKENLRVMQFAVQQILNDLRKAAQTQVFTG